MLHKWCIKWGLVINLQKCRLMHFGYNNKKYQYGLGVEMVNVSNCEKIPGALIHNKLIFKDFVYMCGKKANQVCNMILANVGLHVASESISCQVGFSYIG